MQSFPFIEDIVSLREVKWPASGTGPTVMSGITDALCVLFFGILLLQMKRGNKKYSQALGCEVFSFVENVFEGYVYYIYTHTL